MQWILQYCSPTQVQSNFKNSLASCNHWHFPHCPDPSGARPLDMERREKIPKLHFSAHQPHFLQRYIQAVWGRKALIWRLKALRGNDRHFCFNIKLISRLHTLDCTWHEKFEQIENMSKIWHKYTIKMSLVSPRQFCSDQVWCELYKKCIFRSEREREKTPSGKE